MKKKNFFRENSTKIAPILGKFYKFIENPKNFCINSGYLCQKNSSFFLETQSCLHSVEFFAKNWLEFFEGGLEFFENGQKTPGYTWALGKMCAVIIKRNIKNVY